MRLGVLGTAVSLCLVGLCSAQTSHASIRKDLNVPAEGLSPALQTVGTTYNLQVLYPTAIVKDLKTQGASGSLTPEEALTRVLSGTGLSYKYLDANTVTVFETAVPARAADAAGQDQTNTAQNNSQGAGKNSSREFLLAQATPGQASVSPPIEKKAENPTQPPSIQEVIVTAEKRQERLQDVPVPVTAISGDALGEQNLLRLQDYYTQVPGFSVAPAGILGSTILSIRGISTGFATNPTVGIMVDDVPFGASTQLAGGNVVPDFDPSDLERIEVLRGPQGTLYGASSMGGLLKYVTVDPSTSEVSGRLQVGASGVYNGDEAGYNARGSVNVPLSDTLAVRGSGFTRRDPGYIDDPSHGLHGVNVSDVYGGRLSALWRPLETLSVKLSALLQQSKADGATSEDIALGGLQQSRVPGTGGHDQKAQAYSATVTAELGRGIELTSLSGYSISNNRESIDFSFAIPLGIGLDNQIDWDSHRFTQEVRLSVPIGQRIEWLLGGFYADENAHPIQNLIGANSNTGAQTGVLITLDFPNTYREYAGFTDFTFHVNDRFDVQIGGRQSEIRQTYQETDSGPLLGGGVTVNPKRHSDGNPFTYLLTPRLKISPDLMVYARFASGYRAGGTNSPASLGGPPVPSQYDPDKTRTYEVGTKGSLLDRALTFDASLYYINWSGIQLLVNNGIGYTTNGGRAKSQGVELSMESRPVAGLKVGAWIALGDAELTENLPPTSTVFGASGDRLPYSSRVSGNLSADQEWSLTDRMKGFIGGSLNYIGDRQGDLIGTPARQDLPGYARIDLNAGIRRSVWTADLFVTNVTDRRGILYGGLGAFPPTAFVYIQPRTVGLNISTTF